MDNPVAERTLVFLF